MTTNDEPCVICHKNAPATNGEGLVVSNMCGECAQLVVRFGSVSAVQAFLRGEGAALPRYSPGVGWVYFLAKNTDGTVRLIVRRNGPDIQLLTADGWVARPQLLTRFQDAGFLEEASIDDAREAASAKGLPLAPLTA